MARFLFIKGLCDQIWPGTGDSWLHWSVRGHSSCLRDFRPPKVREHSIRAEEIRQLLEAEGRWENAPWVPIKDTDYWRLQQYLLNVRDKLIEPAPPERLLNLFVNEMLPLLRARNRRGASACVDRWLNGLSAAVDHPGKGELNHWDHTDASPWQRRDTGHGWTAKMLEHCRAKGEIRPIRTGDESLNFALLSMELCFGLSSRANPLQRDTRGSLRLDGLGVREDGSLCIIEVKGPQDAADVRAAFLQGVCGALAVLAKRDTLTRRLRIASGRRPASVARVPMFNPSLGLYILMSTLTLRNRPMYRWEANLQQDIEFVFTAFPQLREVVFFAVPPGDAANFAALKPDQVIRRQTRP